MRALALHSLIAVAFVAVVACGGKTLPGDDPGADSGPVLNDGTCTGGNPFACAVDACGNSYLSSCSHGQWSCVAPDDDCDDISPPNEYYDASVGVDASTVDTGIYPYDATTFDGGVAPDASGIPCGDLTACPSNMFCQEQANFTFQCADYPAACETNHSCTCVLDYGASACPIDFGWSCGTDSVGDIQWACTAP